MSAVIPIKWLTTEKLKDYLGFGNKDLFQEWRESGKLRYYQVGKIYLYNIEDIDQFILKNYSIFKSKR